MALKLMLLAAIVSLAVAQPSVTSGPVPSPSLAVAPSTTVAAPAPTPSPTPMTTPATGEPLVDNTTAENFILSEAQLVRRQHYYCLGVGQSRRDFPNVPRLGLWFQLPVLSYLETTRKLHLFNLIVAILRSSTPPAVIGGVSIGEENVCVAEVEQYGVSTYEESVFIKLYFIRNDGSPINMSSTPPQLRDFETTADAFRTRYSTSAVPFLGRQALNLSEFQPNVASPLDNATVMDSIHPGCDIERCPEGDPTLRAILLGTYYGFANTTYEGRTAEVTVSFLKSGIDGFDSYQSPADNPRPINFGLEPEDIVFAVFGSFFLTLLAAAVVLGFCIHPFFLA